jgi:hypothetical protein
MSSQLHAELIRARQFEIAAAATHAEHRQALRAARRDQRLSSPVGAAGFPRIALIAVVVLSMVLALLLTAV